MKLGKIRKAGVGLVAAAAVAGGTALATAGTASAASGPDGPELSVEQGDFSGDNLELTLTDPNNPLALACTSALLDGATGLQVIQDYNDGNIGDLLSTLTDSDNVTIGPAVANADTSNWPIPLPTFGTGDTDTKTVDVSDGVYFFIGTCGDLSGINPDNIGISFQPVIVPDGIGSLAPASAFGSTASSALPALLSVLGNGGLPSGS